MPYDQLIFGMLVVIMIQLAYIVFLLTRKRDKENKVTGLRSDKSITTDEDSPSEWVPEPNVDDQDERLAKFHNLWPHNR